MFKHLMPATIVLLLYLTGCSGPADRKTPGTTPPPGETSPSVSATLAGSTVERAAARLNSEGESFLLVLLKPDSQGVEREIYDDLTTRQIRATAGPDEGIDTRSVSCYPDCVFVRETDENVLDVETWTQVLRHEERHMEQARNNPELARDFRGPDGRFTNYAAFMEACADYGINVGETYHAQERIDSLKEALGPNMANVLDHACRGDKQSYSVILDQYEQRKGNGAFAQLFPRYD